MGYKYNANNQQLLDETEQNIVASIDPRDTGKSLYLVITEFDNCFAKLVFRFKSLSDS